jgi:hypothetical protein
MATMNPIRPRRTDGVVTGQVPLPDATTTDLTITSGVTNGFAAQGLYATTAGTIVFDDSLGENKTITVAALSYNPGCFGKVYSTSTATGLLACM